MTVSRRWWTLIVGIMVLAALLIAPASSAREPAGLSPAAETATAVLHTISLEPESFGRLEGGAVVGFDVTDEADVAALNGTRTGARWLVETEATPRMARNLMIRGPAVVRYDGAQYAPLPALISPMRVVRAGRHTVDKNRNGKIVDTGCEFAGVVFLDGPASISITDVAFDPEACLMLTEFGHLVTPDPLDGPVSDGVASAPKDRRAPGAGLTAPRDFKAKTRSQVREPAYPVLPATSEVNSWVEVHNGRPDIAPTKAGYTSNHLSSSGWSRTKLSWYKYFKTTYARSSVYSQYKNEVFGRLLCGILWGATHAKHWGTIVIGYKTLSASYTTNTTKWGNCSALLRTNKTVNFWWV